MDWSIQETARLTGTTSRTLRHYDAIGLLPPTTIAANGYRHYDEAALVRLQRILLLRDLGLPLAQIAEVLDRTDDPIAALSKHVQVLGRERERIERQMASVTATITRLEAGELLMAEEMFDGFDHREYEQEVTRRWGAEAYARSDRWWTGLNETERKEWKAQVSALSDDWIAAAEAGASPESQRCQGLADRHIEWLRSVPGTPAHESEEALAGYVRGLAEMYVSDPRFAANYGGTAGAELVRDALAHRLEAMGR
ncbi:MULTISPECIES: MerR family transcriptional regulator [unclassified Brevibacterium]|uniref:MerR family transcriptional regulator n=1 Tax=unclassified Brevibacterium TaxID=2614124 RepID=UPI001E4FA4FA|nr:MULTISPECIES: MerR family transcriptional regulator [unclassified Brevibacterium]MCD1284775.1 MerR family transcriptional regulator [Brevibacterium sp. CCUG 69071]MDK8435604.1 MerR family transcriptional regulator [Brevibacterium sp. H-BE7]